MRILIVAATEFEILELKTNLASAGSEPHTIDFLVTGAGMVPTAFALARQFSKHAYNLVLNLGIAGSFDRNIALGEVLEITADTFAELGAQDDEDFITIDQLGFGESVFTPTAKLEDISNISFKKARAITVNTVHGHEVSIHKIRQRLNPQLESMEGAAFFYACRQVNVPCIQIRSVSNYVEKRNRDAWQIGLAIKNLNNFATGLVNQLINT